MRITFVINGLGYAGAEKVVVFVAQNLQKRGHDVSIINLNSHKGQEDRKPDGIKVLTADIVYKGTLRTNWDWLAFTIKGARLLKSELLVGFEFNCNFAVILAAKKLHIPSIMCERGDPTRRLSAKGLNKLKFKTLNYASGAVFQTQGAAEAFSPSLQKRAKVIPNPIFVEGEIPEIDYSLRPKTVVSLGRIENQQKRLDVMVKSFAIFHNRHPEYVLNIYGSAENAADMEALNSWIKDADLEDSVVLKGVTQNSMTDLSKEGMYIITSDFEGISNALLEAMAVGLPVISTDHSPGGARMLIKDHENGLLVPMRNPEALAAALCEYAENPALAEQCGRAAKYVLDAFSPENIIDMWEKYFIDIAKINA